VKPPPRPRPSILALEPLEDRVLLSGGSSVAAFPFLEDFESGDFATHWEVVEGTQGQVQVTDQNGPYEGTYHATLDDTADDFTYSTNQLTLHVDLAGQSGVELSFAARGYSEEPHPEDVVQVSVDGGGAWSDVAALSVTDAWQTYSHNLDALGLTYSSETLIRFQQYDNFSIPSDGIAIDNVRLTGDSVAPSATGHTPTGWTVPGQTTLAVNFDEPMDPASFTVAADVTSFTGPGGVNLKGDITGHTWTGGNTVLELTFSSQTAVGNYALTLGPNVADASGIDMTSPYTAAFEIVDLRHEATMDSDPGWSLDTGWAYGTPTGGGSGNGDPTSGHTGANVLGYNLAGDYGNNINPARYATTSVIDCTGLDEVTLSFHRWLGVETASYDHASVQVSANGSTWVDVWTNPYSDLSDEEWLYQEFDISATAADESTVYVRFGMGTTDSSVTFPGWNIDDVRVTGRPPAGDTDPPEVASHTPDGTVGPERSAIRFTFDEAMDTSSFATGDDVVSFTGPGGDLSGQITGFTWLESDILEVRFNTQSALGSYAMVVGPNIADASASGNVMSLSYTADFTIADVAVDWTLFVYLAGDNNLETYALDAFLDLASVGSDSNVKVVAVLDRTDGYATTYDDWTGTRVGLISTGNTPTGSWGSDWGEQNLGDPDTLTWFLNEQGAIHPADNYALIVWNHGGGWEGAAWDDTDGDHLQLAEIRTALAGADPGIDIHLVGFDAGQMAMLEVAEELSGEAGVLVASQQLEAWDGWPHDVILTDLRANPSWTPVELATQIVTRYGEAYPSSETLSAVDLTSVGAVTSGVDGLATSIMTDATIVDYERLQLHREAAAYFDDPEFRDLGTFLSLVAADASLPASISTAAQTALTAYNGAILQDYSGPGENGTGLSIYFQAEGDAPHGDYDSGTLLFANNSQWDEFAGWWEEGPSAEAGIDLVGTDFAVFPPNLWGSTGTVLADFSIFNQGDTDTGAFNVAFYVSDDATIDPGTDVLLPEVYNATGVVAQEYLDQAIYLTLPAADPFGTDGDYTIGMVIDSGGAVAETLETNNFDRGVGLDKANVTIAEPAAFPFYEDWETGTFATVWEVVPGEQGRIQITSDHVPYDGSYHVTFDDAIADDTYSLNELVLHIDLSGQSGVFLSFAARDWGDEDHFEDCVQISVDGGETWNDVDYLPLSAGYDVFTYDLDSLGLVYAPDTLIRFAQYDNSPIDSDGIGIDNIRVGHDQVGPRVAAHTPTGGMAPGSVSAVRFTFNEDMDGTSFAVGDDVVSFTDYEGNDLSGTITGFTWIDARTLEVQFTAPTAYSRYRMVIGPDVTDNAVPTPNALDQDEDGTAGEPGDDTYMAEFMIGGVLYEADMASDPGWALDTGWAYGTPTGGGSGGGDPTGGYTGTAVIGTNLAGDYDPNLTVPRYAATPAIDCTWYDNVKLSFYRWLAIESSSFDGAAIEVSADGAVWTEVWSHTGGDFADGAWTYLEYDISAVAAHESTVQVRWAMGPTDGSFEYPGWNIDNVVVIGDPAFPGEIHGTVWDDYTGDGVWDSPPEPGVPNWTVYLDANTNDQFDPGEVSVLTAGDGTYALTNLLPGTYTVATVVPGTWQQSYPLAPSTHTVHLDADEVVTGIDFGQHQADSATPGMPDLLSTHDKGWADDDDLTNLDNSEAGKALEFEVAGTLPGSTISIYADGTFIGNAVAAGTTTVVTTNGTVDVPDGARLVTATQTEVGRAESSHSAGLTVTVETQAPGVTMTMQPGSDTGGPGDDVTADVAPWYNVTVDEAVHVQLDWEADAVPEVVDQVAAGVYAYQAGPLALGTYPIEGTFVDEAGNVTVVTDPTKIVRAGTDLYGIAFDASEPHRWGDDCRVQATVTNWGDTETGAFAVALLVSPNGYISTSDYPFSPGDADPSFVVVVGPIAPGGEAVVDVVVTLPVLPPSGQPLDGHVYVGMIVDPDDDVTEADESNNVNRGNSLDMDRIGVLAPAPDLAGSAFNAAEPLEWGQTFTVDATVGNFSVGAAGEFEVHFYLSVNGFISPADYRLSPGDSDPNYAYTVGGIAPMGSVDVHVTLDLPDVPPPGFSVESVCTVGMIVDAADQVNETSETNNVNRGGNRDQDPVSITGPTPDLIGTAFVSDDPVEWGSDFDVEVSITNQGLGVAGASTARFYASPNAYISVSDLEVGSLAVGTIDPGQTLDFTAPAVTLSLPRFVPAGFPTDGTLYIGMIVDADGALQERDETNNANEGLGLDVDGVTVEAFKLPGLDWATYLGGALQENTSDPGRTAYADVVVDALGTIYACGDTYSTDFPVTDASTHGGDCDAFLAKFDSEGNLLWSTLLGGTSDDRANGLAVTDDGVIYVTGNTGSTNFPVLNAWDPSKNSYTDGWLAKFSATGQMLFSTFVGGNYNDWGEDVVIDADGDLILAMTTHSLDFPTTDGTGVPGQPDNPGKGWRGAALAAFTSTGSMEWATVLAGDYRVYGIAVDLGPDGHAFITGTTEAGGLHGNDPSVDFGTFQGERDMFVAEYDTAGALLWGTYFGGSRGDYGYDVVVDAAGDIYVTGDTYSHLDFPTFGDDSVPFAGNHDAFVVKFDATTRAGIWSTCLGGVRVDRSWSMVQGPDDRIYVVGEGDSDNFPSYGGGDTVHSGNTDGFVAIMDDTTGAWEWATLVGGTEWDCVQAVAVDAAGAIYVLGETASADFPAFDAYDSTYNGDQDAFLARLAFGDPDLAGTAFDAPALASWGETTAIDFTVSNLGDGPSGAVEVKFYVSANSYVSTGDPYLGSYWVAPLAGGATHAVTGWQAALPAEAPAGFAGAGPVYFGMIVDATDAVEELDETNNVNRGAGLDGEWSQVGAPMPDLAGAGLVADDPLVWGLPFTVDLGMENLGNADATASTVRFYLSVNDYISPFDEPVGILAIGAISAGSTLSVVGHSLTMPALPAGFPPEGNIYLGMIVDADGEVDELDESNNTNRATGLDRDRVYVREPAPDLAATSFDVDEWFQWGQTVNVAVTVRNIGDGAAGASTVAYYLSSNGYISTFDIPEPAPPAGAPEGDNLAAPASAPEAPAEPSPAGSSDMLAGLLHVLAREATVGTTPEIDEADSLATVLVDASLLEATDIVFTDSWDPVGLDVPA